MTELKFVDGLKFEGMPKFEVMPGFEGLDLAERTMEAHVLCDGEKPQRFSGTGAGEAGREKLAGMPGTRKARSGWNGSLRVRFYAGAVSEAADGVYGACP
jgi:hypothetical protein